MRRNAAIVVATAAAFLGLVFSAVSTKDFVQHLDRQVHGLHCSFLPGVDEPDVSGETGCHVTLMSPYSSVFRERVWGGVPISLPAMATFAFLAAFGIAILALRKQGDVRAVGFLALAWCLPVLSSLAMGYISLATLDAACKLCIGVYTASAVGFFASLAQALIARRSATTAHPVGEADESQGGTAAIPLAARSVSWGALGVAFAVGVLFVLAPVGTYALVSPDFSRYLGACGALSEPADPGRVLIPIGPQTRSVPVIEVLDPLCPACKGFEVRYEASSVEERTSRRVLLFPLDDECNWMIDRAIHPGACGISEAVLCAEEDAEAVIEWAFEQQTEILAAAEEDRDAARRMARERFPAFADCIGSAQVQARLNQALRWAVANELPVLTPQVYVGNRRLCDADTDLGMDYALTRLVDGYQPGAQGTAPTSAGAGDSR